MSNLTTIDFTVSTNEDWRDAMTFQQGEEGQEEPVDLTGSSLVCHLRQPIEALTTVLVCSTDNGRLNIVETPGTEDTSGMGDLSSIAFDVPADEMALIEPGDYPYDIVWTAPDGTVDRIIEGTVTVQRGVTR